MHIHYLTWKKNIDLGCLEERSETSVYMQTDLERAWSRMFGTEKFQISFFKLCPIFILNAVTKTLYKNIVTPSTSAEVPDHIDLNATYVCEYRV
jgi:hypothetical protein